jgi:hypothetical protein
LIRGTANGDLRDYFSSPFAAEPWGKTTDSKADLGEIVREIDELALLNDEAHHIHDVGWGGLCFGLVRRVEIP